MSDDEEFKKDKQSGCITTIIIAIVGPIMIAAGAFAILLGIVFPSQRDYEKWEWMSTRTCTMVNDIIESKICIGKSSFEVSKILGEPTKPKESGKWTYHIKNCNDLNLNFHLLIVRFGKEGKVEKVEHIIIRD